MLDSHLVFLLAVGLVALPACQGSRARADMLDPISRRLANDDLLAIGRLPEPPSGLFASLAANGDPSVTLFWNASRGASSYGVFLGMTHDPPVVVDVVKTSFSRKLHPGTTYFWRVAALNAEGLMSSELHSFTTSGANPCGTLAAPENLGVFGTRSLRSRVGYELEWAGVEGATAYLVEEATATDPDFDEAIARVIPATRTRATFEHTVSKTTAFYYRVRAMKDIKGVCSVDGPPSESFGFGIAVEPAEAEEPSSTPD